jgi:hypothetical protein
LGPLDARTSAGVGILQKKTARIFRAVEVLGGIRAKSAEDSDIKLSVAGQRRVAAYRYMGRRSLLIF